MEWFYARHDCRIPPNSYNGYNNMKIAFDVDDTLIVPSIVTGLGVDTPNYDTIAIYKWFEAQGHTMIIWSGGGKDYAARWAEKLGLVPDFIGDKFPDVRWGQVDIAFDDCDVKLGTVNVKVKRINNSVDRGEWNKHKE